MTCFSCIVIDGKHTPTSFRTTHGAAFSSSEADIELGSIGPSAETSCEDVILNDRKNESIILKSNPDLRRRAERSVDCD
jgi:hypothetical protein